MQQTLLPKKELRHIKARTHGGMSFQKRRKIKRPLVPKAVTHLVLKSSKARGALSFYRHKGLVSQLLKTYSRKNFVELLDFVNMGNHLHLKVRFQRAEDFQNFLRVFCGVLSRKITNAHRGTRFGRFWDGLAYTRVLLSRLEELGLRVYFAANLKERELGPTAREQHLRHWNRYLSRLRGVRAGPVGI